MKFTKKLLACLMLVCMVLSLTACGGGKKAEEKAPEAPAQQTEAQEPAAESRTFAIVYPIVHPFFEPIGVDAEEYAKTANCSIITKAPEIIEKIKNIFASASVEDEESEEISK